MSELTPQRPNIDSNKVTPIRFEDSTWLKAGETNNGVLLERVVEGAREYTTISSEAYQEALDRHTETIRAQREAMLNRAAVAFAQREVPRPPLADADPDQFGARKKITIIDPEQ